MYPKNLLTILALILLTANCFVILEYDQELSRWARFLSTFFFIIILLWRNSVSRTVLGAMIFLLISDLFLFHYENAIANSATFIMRISAYIALVMAIMPELRNLEASIFQKLLFVVVLALNIAMLYMLVEMVPGKFSYPMLATLFYAYGVAMIAMVIAAISYSNRFSNRTSFYFTAGTLALVLSDITSFIAYYLEFSIFYFPDRIFYILGLVAIVRFANFSRSQEAVEGLETV